MKIELIKDHAFDQNSFLIINNNNECLIVDPGYQDEDIINYIDENKLAPLGVLLTHYHFDHVKGVNSICPKYGIKAHIHENDYPFLIKDTMATWAGFAPLVINKDVVGTFNSSFFIKDFDIQILLAPGHSKGSTVFVFGKAAFTGDVIFDNSFGRIDLPGGDANEMNNTLRTLKTNLSGVKTLYAGHGPNIKNK